MKPRSARRNKGYILIFTAVLAIFLIAFMGLAIDVGYMGYQRARIQLAADGAASAAGTEAGLGSSSATITTAGKRGAALNGFTDGSNNVTVTINNPPTSGDFVNNTSYYEAVVAQTSGTFFMRMMGFDSLKISARAVSSKATGSNSQATPCIYVLDSTATNALTITGTVTVNVCGIQVNSNASSAMKQTGSAITTANFINLVGSGYTKTGSGTLNPTPVTNQSVISDPLASRAAPNHSASCDYTNFSTSSAVTLNPGVYCGGITITGSNNTTFNSGVYILLGGGSNVNSGGTTTGNGVTFYLTKDNTHPYAGISIGGSGTYNLVAPTSGTLEAMLFFQDRTVGSYSNSITGSANLNLTGVIYLPTQDLKYAGSGTAPYTVLVNDTMTFNGTTTLGNDYSTLTHGNPMAPTKSALMGE